MVIVSGRREMVMKPAWLEGLIAETFFAACGAHENQRKNEKNIFCLECCRSICPHCVPSHRSHPLLQARRYVYHDVVRLDDLEKLIDCSYIQVDHVVFQGGDLSSILYRFDESDLAASQFEGLRMDGSDLLDDGQITRNFILEEEDPLQLMGSSCSSNTRDSSGMSQNSEVVKKKKKGSGFLPGIVLSFSRRKGAPQRSPLS
ncbi:uncharacterized protein LOC122059267 isoform X2 [Macadamia integrifolia]|uniref:uncharacterized protein LOC122059267 isoform X2 n=1 Tax=Macadamia integrifolia TaxID=60698 RepID=UPI001C5341F2|nr:uncharacterized protein LOC122059267 isoform X2 [Macadamia integrifolia]